MKTYKQLVNEIKQEYPSDETSINQVAAGFKKIKWNRGDVNLDYGGGKFETATDWLWEQGVVNLVYDKFNRSDAHNQKILEMAKDATTTTCFNVLNVIKEPEIRKQVIKECRRENTKFIFFSVYEGKGTGEGAASKGRKRAWQNNMKLADYLDEIKAVYPSAKKEKGMIVVRL